MRVLAFQADRFAWKPFQQTLPDADPGAAGAALDAIVLFLHAEARDCSAERRESVLRHAAKFAKWLARKSGARAAVLHSFAHLGAEAADPEFARGFIAALQERLEAAGFAAQRTPFGWTCSWEIAVRGESLAKVFKEL